MTNQPVQAHCDQGCGKSFTINKFRSRKVKYGNEKTYFLCPHCKHEYVAYYSSKKTERLQKKMRQLHVSMRGVDQQTLAGLTYKESLLKTQIMQSMDEARAMSEG